MLLSKLYYQPLLTMTCEQVGKGLLLYEHMPKTLGDLRVTLGDDVTLSGEQVWIAGGPGGQQRLVIGNNSYIGHAVHVVWVRRSPSAATC